MTPEQKDQFAETSYKRLFWQGYKGRFGVYQWPTTFSFGTYLIDDKAYKVWVNGAIAAITDPTNYDRGEWSAWRSGLGLRRLLESLNAQYPGQVYMFAHSMGNVVAGEALRTAAQANLSLVNTYVATQAAVPAHCYDGGRGDDLMAAAPIIGTILPRAGFTYPETPNIYRDWFAATATAASRRVSFFNSNDYALWNDCWQLNQYLKPDQSDLHQNYDYTYDGADYSVVENKFSRTFAIVGSKTPLDFGNSSNLQDRHEVLAMAAESRSKALGGVSDVAFEKPPVDLREIWNLDAPDDGPKGSGGQAYGAHKWHSGQFRSTNMRQKGYWRALLNRRGFDIISSP